MKRLFVIMLFLLLYSFNSLGQKRKINIYEEKCSLQDIFSNIEDQTNYTFLYFHKDVKNITIKNIRIASSKIEYIMNILIHNTNLDYKIKKNVIIISLKKVRKRRKDKRDKCIVKGYITDENNIPVPGTTIFEKNSNLGVISDINGHFELGIQKNSTIIFSFVGKQSQNINIIKDTTIKVILKNIVYDIDEIYVTGYETEKKQNISGSIFHLKSDDINNSPTETLEKSIQGKVSGVLFTPSSGIPGSPIDINIRGIGSINANNNPLIIVDGVKINMTNTTNLTSGFNPLSSLNQEDILSIDIIKDGASSSIYGSQAANGIIIITTKKGKEGKFKFKAKASIGISSIVKKLNILNGSQWAELSLLNFKNRFGKQNDIYKDILNSYISKGWGNNGYSNAPTTDWQNAIFRTGQTNKLNLSCSGGSKTSSYYISGEYQKIDGIILGTNFEKLAFRINNSTYLSKDVIINYNIFYNTTQQNSSMTGSTFSNPNRSAILTVPTNTIKDDFGNFNTKLLGTYYHNIIQTSLLNTLHSKTNRLLSKIELQYKLNNNITFKSLFGIDLIDLVEDLFIDPKTPDGEALNGQIEVSNIRRKNLQFDNVLSYNNTDTNKNQIAAILGTSYQEEEDKSNGSSGIGIATPDFKLLGQTAHPRTVSQTYEMFKIIGIFSKFRYSYDNRYFISTTLRYDGSSRFGEKKQFGLFPSISTAWRISSENFMNKLTFITNLKLKASYGITGNTNIGSYLNYKKFVGEGEYNDESSIKPSKDMGNNGIKWEENHTFNCGINISLLNKLQIEVDLYNRTTKNLLIHRELPFTTGHDYIWENTGEVINEGIELSLKTMNISTSFLNWTTKINFAYNNNRISKLPGKSNQIGTLYKIDESIGSAYTYRYAGVNPADGRPMWYDKNNNTTFHPKTDDRIWLASYMPKLIGGFSNSIKINNFTFYALFDFQNGARKLNTNKYFLSRGGSTADRNQTIDNYYNYWKKEGDITYIPKPVYGRIYPDSPTRQFFYTSDFLYEKTDFIKLRSAYIKYKIPKKICTQFLKCEQICLYINAYNIWTTSTYSGFDPEFKDDDNGLYPSSKTISFGIDILF